MNTIDARLERIYAKLDQERMKWCGKIRCEEPATFHVVCADGAQARLCNVHYREIGGARVFAKVEAI